MTLRQQLNVLDRLENLDYHLTTFRNRYMTDEPRDIQIPIPIEVVQKFKKASVSMAKTTEVVEVVSEMKNAEELKC
ncbi:hypothetical protein ACQKOF_12190 [Lysinibacillus sp. NPDC093190]|uniref:hypothetical protein n=1 Tax=Lysinibacillus sp. NPDC093190 TaxID=3390575 RepID=UPI003CFF267D